ncbi:biotin--[acetyl-CoA-carboxylase] ligase [Prochlorococcus marinus XMU1408]|uniref:Biotin--[acetyl-CoA-carboxylase] ligase n=1 Tax=Prochlorococcus marinus XMU1408 TaxID=2213228 RepID=A0A318R3A6_PROMR|nr:biotin--[acetyl-CoA-carboxylase] ligase [Prochlorococcus marinus str. XMU1408]PYE03265.1 biotin--[acetyl-CoA-carboxylase] ligase [Prochlorococcus marinus XMU1408]
MLKPICASTEIELSNWIAEKPVKKNKPIAIFSSCQKFGQGQAGRTWYAPKGGVWVSAAIKRKGSCEHNSQLYGLAVALALVERIERIGVNVKIKWPNDLLVDGQKLAGILPRLIFRGGKLRLLRVGVGLNVLNNVPKDGISLKQIIGDKTMNINFWSSEVLCAIDRSLDLLDNKHFLCSQIEKRLWSRQYIDKKTRYQWDIKGIDSAGRLILFNDGQEKVLST